MITIENLVFEYPTKRALHHINLSIGQNQITALVGPNGAGKSTLMRCIVGLEMPLEGTVIVNGVDVGQSPRQVHAFTGYLSDFFGLYTDLTVTQNLHYAAMSHLFSPQEATLRANEVIEQLGLEQYRTTQTGELSRGWHQRVGIGMAMVHKPKVLLLDEPASGLDPGARAMLSQLLLDLQSQGLSIIVSSHILSELEGYCNNMVILEDGRMVEHAQATQDDVDSHLLIIEVVDNHQAVIDYLTEQAPVVNCILDASSIVVEHHPDEQWINQLLTAMVQAGFEVTKFNPAARTLQDRYHRAVSEKGSQT